MHIDSMIAIGKLIQTNQSFMGGPGSHSQTQARRAAAHGDCYVSKYLWASCSGHSAMRKRTKSWRRLGVWGCRYVDILLTDFQNQKLRGFRLANNRQRVPLIYTFHTCLSITKSHRLLPFSDDLQLMRRYTGQQTCSCVPGYCNSTVVWAARTWTFLLYTIYMHEPFDWPHKVQYFHICWKYNSKQLGLDQKNKWRHQPHVVLGEEGHLVIVFVRVPWWVMSWINYVCVLLPKYVIAFCYNTYTPTK